MAITKDIEINGFVFVYHSGLGIGDGFSIQPDDLEYFDDPEYLKALKAGLLIYPYLYYRELLSECYGVKNDAENVPLDSPEDAYELIDKANDLENHLIDAENLLDQSIRQDWYDFLTSLRVFATEQIPILREKQDAHLFKVNREKVFERDNHRCRYCGKELKKSNYHVDHILPRSKGGTSEIENLVTACKSCNSKKGAKTPEEAGLDLQPEYY